MTTKTALHTLHNGRYRIQLTPFGGGRSSRDGIALNRWPADSVEDGHGFFLFLRDLDNGALWSAGLRPVLDDDEHEYRCEAANDQVVLHRRRYGIASALSVSVDPHDDIEYRQLHLHNHSTRTRRIEVTSYIEVALADAAADLNHPCFLKLFVQTECNPERGVLLASRRPRAHDERWPTIVHAMRGAHATQWETDRLRFLGRGRPISRPAMIMEGGTGNVLDPAFSLRSTVTLRPGESSDIGFLLGIADDRDTALQLAVRHGALPFAPDVTSGKTTVDPPELVHGFAEDGREYRIRLPWAGNGLRLPPAPWINVLANEHFGCLISETGAGGSWSLNSQLNRLTPWPADPVGDPHGEALYLRDEDSGECWSPLPGPRPAATTYEVAHGFGYSRFRCVAHELESTVTVFVARNEPLKFVSLQLRNTEARARRLSVFSYQRLVLGTLPDPNASIQTWHDDGMLCARNEATGDFGARTAFTFTVGAPLHGFSCDRRRFLGSGQGPENPQALREAVLDGRCGTAIDPCFAQQCAVELPAGGQTSCGFVLGETGDDADLRSLRRRYTSTADIDAACTRIVDFWRDALGGVRVRTPSPAVDAMVNGWLPYQALACRIWARTAFYQSSGAFGFRDQLQDAGNLSLLWPDRARDQILLHARRQFSEGDVLHWWHDEPVMRGVRTRFSDDLLWLPYVTARYVHDTGDAAVYDGLIPFLEAPVLSPEEDERYLRPMIGEEASLYEHCCRAIDRSLTQGAHGLPLMGTGDWNDGMNRVGCHGRGESVWLGFFLYDLLAPFADLAQRRGDTDRAARYQQFRDTLAATLNDTGWDGAWYRRAYDDDGIALGTSAATECRIDGLAQSWAVLSGAAPPDRAKQAMDAAEAELVSEADGLIRLLTPPFVDIAQDPGYIKGYVAGVRENGGQYTHAACWLVAALAKLGRRDRAAPLLAMLAPHAHADSASAVERYKVEPYVIAADVYGAEPHIGRGGWTWYTGSAGWAWRVATESILGMSLIDGQRLRLRPCIPDYWPGFELDFRPAGRNARYRIVVSSPQSCSECITGATLDGTPLDVADDEVVIDLSGDDQQHQVTIILGAKRSLPS